MNSHYSTLGVWRRLWDWRLNDGLHGPEFKNLRHRGFETDAVSFQLKRVRRIHRAVPAWAASIRGIRRVLLSAFPHPERPDQRRQAGRWARVIELYFRSGLPEPEVAAELGMSLDHLSLLVRRIRRRAAKPSMRPVSSTQCTDRCRCGRVKRTYQQGLHGLF